MSIPRPETAPAPAHLPVRPRTERRSLGRGLASSILRLPRPSPTEEDPSPPAAVGDGIMLVTDSDGRGIDAMVEAVASRPPAPVTVMTWAPTHTWGELSGDAWRNGEAVRRALGRDAVRVRSHRGPVAGLADEAEANRCGLVVIARPVVSAGEVARLRRRIAATPGVEVRVVAPATDADGDAPAAARSAPGARNGRHGNAAAGGPPGRRWPIPSPSPS